MRRFASVEALFNGRHFGRFRLSHPTEIVGGPIATGAVAGAGGDVGCAPAGRHASAPPPDTPAATSPTAIHFVLDLLYKVYLAGKAILRLGKKGGPGMGPNNFNLPTDVAFAPNGDVYVSDG